MYSLARYWNGKVEVRICTGRLAIDETAATGKGFLSGFKLFHPFSDLKAASSAGVLAAAQVSAALIEESPPEALTAVGGVI